MTEHTILPWAIEDDQASISARGGEDWIADCNQLNGLSYEECEANASYIVKACNAFPDLVKALEEIADPLNLKLQGVGLARAIYLINRMSSTAKQALAAVKGASK
jgi:hypothetical protein